MKLMIGGKAQSKLQVAMDEYGILPEEVYENKSDAFASAKIWNQYHRWFQKQMECGELPEEKTREWIARNPNILIISDEVGNGIVPMEKSQREYRERLGRMLCELAKEATSVERVICGISQKLK